MEIVKLKRKKNKPRNLAQLLDQMFNSFLDFESSSSNLENPLKTSLASPNLLRPFYHLSLQHLTTSLTFPTSSIHKIQFTPSLNSIPSRFASKAIISASTAAPKQFTTQNHISHHHRLDLQNRIESQ
jgi:hypothetical protein